MSQATNKKGAPTQQAANAYAAQMKASRVAPHTWQDFKKPTPVQIYNGGGEVEAFRSLNSTKYPQRPLPLDDRDSEFAMIQDLREGVRRIQGEEGELQIIQGESPYITSARPLPIQDWELQYMKDKAANEDYAAYRQWLSNKYDLNDMATRAWFKQIAPEYFTEKRELLKELMDRHAKYSLLRLAGPENEEDLRFEYAVETGRIPIPKGPFYNPLEWATNEVGESLTVDGFMQNVATANQKAYQYGMFNPVKPRTAEQGAMAGNSLNPQDLVGAPQTRSYGFSGQYVPTDYNWRTQYTGQHLTGGRSLAGNAAIQERRMMNSENGGLPAGYNTNGTPINPVAYYNARTQAYHPTPASYNFPTKRLWNWTAAALPGGGAPLAPPLPEEE
jgi:hypothetical protein